MPVTLHGSAWTKLARARGLLPPKRKRREPPEEIPPVEEIRARMERVCAEIRAAQEAKRARP